MLHAELTSPSRALRAVTATLALAIALAAIGPTAHADERGPNLIRVDLGGAYSFRANDPRDRFGFGGALEYERRLGRFFGIGARVAGLAFLYDETMYAGSGYSSYVGIGPNLRLHLTPGLRRGDLWVATGGQVVITGDLVRAGIDGGLGFDIGVSRNVAIGPFARYLHVFQPASRQLGSADGRMIFFGLSLSWGQGLRDEPEDDVEDEPEDEVEPEDEPIDATEPTDGTGTADGSRTPDGSATDRTDTPTGRDPIDTTEPEDEPTTTRTQTRPTPAIPTGPGDFGVTLRFESDRAALTDDTVRQLLDVLERLRTDPSIERVLIVGHADHLGESDYNVDLSERRARNVLEWFVRRGIPRSRLEARGVGFSEPLVDGATPESLAPNRRVELFIVDPASR